MALDKDILGLALYNVRDTFSNKTKDELITTYGTIENARIAQAKSEANEIINHFKSQIEVSIPGTGMVSNGFPVTGLSTTGTIQ